MAAVVEVCPDCPLHSLKQAVHQASSGDTINVRGGRYAEGMLVIDKSLKLIGIQNPVIDGLHAGNVIYIRADDVTLSGFTIENSGMSYTSDLAGLRIEESKNCHIEDNVFKEDTYAIYLAKVSGCVIENNWVSGSVQRETSGGDGIHAWSSDHLTLRKNILEGQRDGIYLEFSGDSLIENNISRHNLRYGLHFMYSHRNRYYRNQFVSNQTGVAVMYSKNIEMVKNTFEKSWGAASYGLLLKDIDDSLIEGNYFLSNTIGVLIDGGNRSQFKGNVFRYNGWAINFYGNSEKNSFTENNFISNYFDVATNAQTPANEFHNNYWNDYRGYDLNHDGLGDVPFRPMKVFTVWVNRYPELIALFGSPIVEFLEVAERIFPVFTPKTLVDPMPVMVPKDMMQ